MTTLVKTSSVMENWISMMKADYDLCINHYLEFQNKLADLSTSHNLKGKYKLMADLTPLYFVGAFDSDIVWFTLNGHYGKGNTVDNVEEVEARKGWPEYLDLFRGFYKSEVYKSGLVNSSRYYKAKGKLLCGLTGMKDPWKCFDRYLLTLQLIPYRSIGTPSLRWSTYLNSRFLSMLEVAKISKRKLLIFNGKIFYDLLSRLGYLDNAVKKDVTDKFTMYLFKIDGVPCFLFEQFFSGHWWHLTSEDRSVTIPNLIKAEFGELK